MHLDRLITILELVAVAGRGLTVVEVQKATGLPRPTCYRLMQTLADQRLIDVTSAGSSRYVVGERLIRIALLGKSDIDVRHACAPLLREAALNIGDTVFLSRLRSKEVEIIHVETPPATERGYIHPGFGVRPIHACSCSKAIAAFAEESFKEDIFAGILKAYTPHTKTTRAELEADLAKIAKKGFAECHEEVALGVSSVAAPVRIGHIGATFSIGSVGSVRRFTAQYREALGKALISLSTKIGAAIQCSAIAQARGENLPTPVLIDDKEGQLPIHH